MIFMSLLKVVMLIFDVLCALHCRKKNRQKEKQSGGGPKSKRKKTAANDDDEWQKLLPCVVWSLSRH